MGFFVPVPCVSTNATKRKATFTILGEPGSINGWTADSVCIYVPHRHEQRDEFQGTQRKVRRKRRRRQLGGGRVWEGMEWLEIAGIIYELNWMGLLERGRRRRLPTLFNFNSRSLCCFRCTFSIASLRRQTATLAPPDAIFNPNCRSSTASPVPSRLRLPAEISRHVACSQWTVPDSSESISTCHVHPLIRQQLQ